MKGLIWPFKNGHQAVVIVVMSDGRLSREGQMKDFLPTNQFQEQAVES